MNGLLEEFIQVIWVTATGCVGAGGKGILLGEQCSGRNMNGNFVV